jgi:NAD(P)-dependent dehydrogenase (short-subunit alcohol dehydrogenase family)
VDLRGRCALVTGGAVRVGRALSLGLAAEGARVAIHYNGSAGEAEQVAEKIRSNGGEAVTIAGDLSELAGVHSVADAAVAAWGGLDVLVNNASVFPDARFDATDAEVWDLAMAVNLRAPFFLTQQLAGALGAGDGGVVVNLVDLAGLQVWGTHVAHGISKAGLVHFTRVAARALAPRVRVNAIAPGTVLPPDDTPEEEIERLARRAPLGRIGEPGDVLSALLYLVRAEFVTGEILTVDGGRALV